MYKSVETYLKREFPNTFNGKSLLISGSIFFTLSSIDLFNSQINAFLNKSIQVIGLGLLGLYFLVLVLEILGKIFNVFQTLLNIIVKLLYLIKSLYIGLWKILIGDVIKSILKESEDIRRNILVLRKENGDDAYWDSIINFDSGITTSIFKVSPSSDTKYWRLGLKFSQNDTFTTARYAKDYPLFHLTKDISNDLKVMDAAAISLSRENKIPIIVFNLETHGAMGEVLQGKGKFTLIEER